MRILLRNQLVVALRILAQLTIRRYRPGVVAVTGSVGKTSTKEAIAAVLSGAKTIRASHGNFNTEIGVPLTILGEWKAVGGVGFWIWVCAASLWRLMVPRRYPELLILEYAADRPGDVRRLIEIAKPNVSVVTAVGETPVHVEFYPGPEAVAREKGRLVECLTSSSFAVLNADDADVLAMQARTRASVLTFGFNKDADVVITGFEQRIEDAAVARNSSKESFLRRPAGVSFKLQYAGSFVPVRIDGCLGTASAYAAAAATAVGITFGMHLVQAAEALRSFRPPAHRLQLVAGARHTQLVDDTYNASPLSMRLALDAMGRLKARRKVGILGDMRELGAYETTEHEAVGKLAAKVFDQLITVGDRARFIADGARAARMPARQIVSVSKVEELLPRLLRLIRPQDLVLIKGSRAVGLEAAVAALAAVSD